MKLYTRVEWNEFHTKKKPKLICWVWRFRHTVCLWNACWFQSRLSKNKETKFLTVWQLISHELLSCACLWLGQICHKNPHILTRVEFIGNHCEDLGFSRKSYKIMGTILLFYYKSRSYIIQCSCTYGKTWCFVGDTELFSCKFDLRWESTLIDIWQIYGRYICGYFS